MNELNPSFGLAGLGWTKLNKAERGHFDASAKTGQ
jgi:hypothetical protein